MKIKAHKLVLIMEVSFTLEPITGVFIPHNLIPDTLWEVSIIFVRPEA